MNNIKYLTFDFKTHSGSKDINQLFFVNPPSEIGKIISAESNLYEEVKKDKTYYNTFIAELGVGVFVLKDGNISKEIILFDDEKFEKKLKKYEHLASFYVEALAEYYSNIAIKFQDDLINGKEIEIEQNNLKFVFSKNYFKLYENEKLIIDGLFGFEIIDDKILLIAYDLESFVFKPDLKIKTLFKIYQNIYKPEDEKFKKAQEAVKNHKNKRIKRNLIISVIAGFLIVFGIYIWEKVKHNYASDFDFYRDFNSLLFAVSVWGFWIGAFLWKLDFFKYLMVSMAIVFLGYVFTYEKARLDKTIYLENFSNTLKIIEINGKKIKVSANSEKILEFPKVDVKVQNIPIKERGCYIVNLSHPQKFYKYGLVQHVLVNGVGFDITNMIGEVRDKIYKLDDRPNCFISRVKHSFGKEAYYIEAFDAN